MQNFSTIIPVVAVALIDVAGRVLMQRRRLGGAHGGLWEFPGGKVEAAETPVTALIREISEELGVTLAAEALSPLTFATDPAQPHVILLYTCHSWSGEPVCLDGEEIAWFAPEALTGLAMPPLDMPLSRALQLLLRRGDLPACQASMPHLIAPLSRP